MQQHTALNILKSGRNVFLTGQAGSGKTYVINQFVRYLRNCGVDVAITASTGIAATHINGTTIHSWSGIGIKEDLLEQDLDRILQKENIYNAIKKTSVLIIDEVSMLSATALDLVDLVCQNVRRDGRPFGGMQVILCGDFFQLPPVMKFDPNANENKRFVFASKARKTLDLAICYLTTQHRQDDSEFKVVLNELRVGQLSPESLVKIKSRLHQPITDKQVVKLYTHNTDVDRINAIELEELDTEERTYTCGAKGNKLMLAGLMKSMLAPDRLTLKIGAKVIFLKNNPAKGYFNGTTGLVIDFDKKEKYPIVQTSDGYTIKVEPETRSVENADQVVASVTQIPLKLAWAITIHKSQGMTLDAAEIDLSKVREPGQAYVALSRVRSLDGLTLNGLNEQGLVAHPLVMRGDAYFMDQSEKVTQKYAELDDEARSHIHQVFVTSVGGTYKTEDELVDQIKEKTHVADKVKKTKTDTIMETLQLLREGSTIEQIAQSRGLANSTIIQHLAKIKQQYPDADLSVCMPEDTTLIETIRFLVTEKPQVFGEGEYIKTKPLYEELRGQYSYDEIRLALLWV